MGSVSGGFGLGADLSDSGQSECRIRQTRIVGKETSTIWEPVRRLGCREAGIQASEQLAPAAKTSLGSQLAKDAQRVSWVGQI